MEQLPQKNQKSAIVISTTGLIRKASGGVKVRELKNVVPLKQGLAYCFKLIGLKTLPDELETQVLIDFIAGAYGGLCAEEIKVAFKLGCKGDLDVEMNHYQAFTPLYLGRVLKAYSELRQKELAKAQSKLPTSFREHPIDPKQYLMDKLYAPYEMLKKGKYLFTNLDEGLLYKKLDRMGLVIATTEQKKEAMIEARERIQKKCRQNEDEYLKKVKEKAKELCFRNWIENCALEDKDLRTEINKL